MKSAVAAIFASIVIFITPVSYAGHMNNLPHESTTAPKIINLPDFRKPPYFLIGPSAIFPSRVYPELPPRPWLIFITYETKRNFIAVYYDGTAIRYAEWALDTDEGVVIRGYQCCIDGKFVFDKEVPRPTEK